MPKLQLQNPGPWSFAVVTGAMVLVAAMFILNVPNAGKCAAAIVSVLGTWFARSALAPKDDDAGGEAEAADPEGGPDGAP